MLPVKKVLHYEVSYTGETAFYSVFSPLYVTTLFGKLRPRTRNSIELKDDFGLQ